MSPDNLVNYIPYNKLTKNTDEYKELFFTYMSKELDSVVEMGHVIPFDNLVDFLYVFAGKTIKIPEPRVVLNCFRALDIYFSLIEKDNHQEVVRLAQKYSIPTDKVKTIQNNVRLVLEEKNPSIKTE